MKQTLYISTCWVRKMPVLRGHWGTFFNQKKLLSRGSCMEVCHLKAWKVFDLCACAVVIKIASDKMPWHPARNQSSLLCLTPEALPFAASQFQTRICWFIYCKLWCGFFDKAFVWFAKCILKTRGYVCVFVLPPEIKSCHVLIIRNIHDLFIFLL